MAAVNLRVVNFLWKHTNAWCLQLFLYIKIMRVFECHPHWKQGYIHSTPWLLLLWWCVDRKSAVVIFNIHRYMIYHKYQLKHWSFYISYRSEDVYLKAWNRTQEIYVTCKSYWQKNRLTMYKLIVEKRTFSYTSPQSLTYIMWRFSVGNSIELSRFVAVRRHLPT